MNISTKHKAFTLTFITNIFNNDKTKKFYWMYTDVWKQTQTKPVFKLNTFYFRRKTYSLTNALSRIENHHVTCDCLYFIINFFLSKVKQLVIKLCVYTTFIFFFYNYNSFILQRFKILQKYTGSIPAKKCYYCVKSWFTKHVFIGAKAN